MVPLAAEGVTFFACAKKVTKETHPRRHALRAARFGSASGPGISVRHIPVPYENAAHPGRRPAGLTRPTRRASWGSEGRSKEHSPKAGSRCFRSGSRGPLGPAVTAGKTPQGRRTGRAPFSAGAGSPVRKFSPGLRTRRAAAGGPPGGVSLAYFSLHKQRKVGPPRRAAPCVNKEGPSRKAIELEGSPRMW